MLYFVICHYIIVHQFIYSLQSSICVLQFASLVCPFWNRWAFLMITGGKKRRRSRKMAVNQGSGEKRLVLWVFTVLLTYEKRQQISSKTKKMEMICKPDYICYLKKYLYHFNFYILSHYNVNVLLKLFVPYHHRGLHKEKMMDDILDLIWQELWPTSMFSVNLHGLPHMSNFFTDTLLLRLSLWHRRFHHLTFWLAKCQIQQSAISFVLGEHVKPRQSNLLNIPDFRLKLSWRASKRVRLLTAGILRWS